MSSARRTTQGDIFGPSSVFFLISIPSAARISVTAALRSPGAASPSSRRETRLCSLRDSSSLTMRRTSQPAARPQILYRFQEKPQANREAG